MWFNSLGAAYAAADVAAKQGHEIRELFPFAGKGHLFLSSTESLNLQKLKEQPNQSIEIDNLSEAVLRAYLSLDNPPIEDFLMIIEADFLGEVFMGCQKAIDSGLKIVDLRFVRDASGHSYAFLTGKESDGKKYQASCPSQLQARYIDSPADGLKAFFS